MLVLSRKKNEIIVIPGLGTIMVIEIRGDKVRLGLDFDQQFKIYRQEIWVEIQAVEAAAVEGAANEEAADISH